MCFSVQQNNKQTCKKHVKNVLKPLILWIELSPSPIFYCGLWTFANSTSYSSFVLDLSWDFATSLGLWQARSTAIWNSNGPYWYRKKKGCNFLGEFFPVFFWDFFPVFWGLMVLIGICSVLQLSSLICMVLLLWLDGWIDGWMVGWLVG